MESVPAKSGYNNEMRAMSSINVYYFDLRDGIVNEKRLFKLIALGIVKIEAKENFVTVEGEKEWIERGLYNSI